MVSLAFLDPRANAALEARGFVRGEALPQASLAALLERHSLPSYPGLFAMEEQAGGLATADGSWLVGPSSAIVRRGRAAALRTPEGTALVLVAVGDPLARFVDPDARERVAGRIDRLVRAELYGMDAAGAIWATFRAERVAASFQAFLGKLAAWSELGDGGRVGLVLRPRVGASLAASFGAEKLVPASDDVHVLYRSEALLVEDGAPSGGDAEGSVVWARDEPTAARVIASLAGRAGVVADLLRSPRDAECLPPSEAPEAATSLAPPSPRLPLGGGDPRYEGALVARDGVRLERVRTREDRVQEQSSTSDARDYRLATEHLAPHVSLRCQAWLRARGVIHEPEDVWDRAALTRALEEAGLPTLAAALDFEEQAGGLWLPSGRGVELCSFGVGLQLADGVRAEDGRVPMGCLGAGQYALDERGHVFAEDDTMYGPTAVASSWRVLFERMALGNVYPLEVGGWPARLKLGVTEDVAREIGESLGLALAPELSDAYESYWLGEGTSVWRAPAYLRGYPCVVSAERVRDLVIALGAAARASRGARASLLATSEGGAVGEPPSGAWRFPGELTGPQAGATIVVLGDSALERHAADGTVQRFVN